MNSLQKNPNNRILAVDDEEEVLDFLCIFLSSLGWNVITAQSSSIALEQLEARSHFMVLTDIAMPELDGYEFINAIRDRHIPCEFAMMTGFGYNPNHTLVKINKNMKCPFFFKPFDRIKLSEGVQAAWNKYHAELHG